MAEPQSVTVNLKVTNHNDFKISDMFDGVPFDFEPGQSLVIPPEAALHIFAWKPGANMAEVERHVQKRWGWNIADLQKDGIAAGYFRNIELKPVTYRMVEVREDDDDIPAAPRSRSASGKFVAGGTRDAAA
jgi:hypothetical protein